MKNCSGSAEIKRKWQWLYLWGYLSVKEHFLSLKVYSHVTPSAALQQSWRASCQTSHLQNTRGLVPGQPQASTLSATAPTLQPGHQKTSTSLCEETCKKDAVRTQPELGQLQKSLLHQPFNNASAQERAHPDSALNWSSGEKYV